MVNPTPRIICDGIEFSCATTKTVDGQTVFRLDQPTLVGDLTIEWGREDQWTQPDPSVLTFKIWEPQPGEWIQRVTSQRAMRRGTVVFYNKGGRAPVIRNIFQGFTTNVDITASVQQTERGPMPGWMVEIQATDRTGFLGQVNWYSGQLPEERMDQRAVRIRNQGAPVGIREMYFEDRYRAGQVKPVDVTDKTVLDTLSDLYKSFADQWYYEPQRNVVNRIPTGSNWAPYGLRFGYSDTDNAVRLYPPAWVDPTGQQDPQDQEPYPAAYIGGCDVSGQIALSASNVQDITVISCKWFNKPGNADHTTDVDVQPGAFPPVRLEFESWYNDGVYVDSVIDSVKAMVAGDGARPTHPQIRWDTRKTRDVPDWSTFESMALPAQTIRMVTLAGSPFSAATGYAPVWHPCGGVIRYGGGRWDFTTNLAPTSMPRKAGGPITPANVDRAITLADGDYYLDHSVTPFDLNYVDNADGRLYYYD